MVGARNLLHVVFIGFGWSCFCLRLFSSRSFVIFYVPMRAVSAVSELATLDISYLAARTPYGCFLLVAVDCVY